MGDAACDVDVLIVAHGERGGRADNQVLLTLRDRVAAMTAVGAVHAGALNGEPTVEQAWAAIEQRRCKAVLVFPFFMSDGYFVRTVVPQRLAATRSAIAWRILPPLGLDPGLPQVICGEAAEAARAVGWAASHTRLLLVGHGSKFSRASAQATHAAAAAVAALGKFRSVETAFLEEPPLVDTCLAADPAQTVVVGFLSGEGLHAGDDIPAAIARNGGRARYCGPIGAAAGVAGLVAGTIQNALGEMP